MQTPYPHLFSPGRIGTLELRNRTVMAPIDSVFRTELGDSTPRHQEYMAARAAGGVGLIICDNAVIDYPRGSVGSRPLRIDQDRFVASLGELVDAVHHHDVPIFAQIAHSGRQTTLGGSQGQTLVSASAIPWADSGTIPRELSRDEIASFLDEYVEAAKRARQAGFDGIEVHAAHGYLMASFLSPALNRRTDEYGGSTEARARLVTEAIGRVKAALGDDYPVIVRINGRDGIPNGIEPEEAAAIARLCQDAGADGIDVSAGTYEASRWTFPPMMYPEGALLELVPPIKAAVSIPVIAVGKLSTPSFVEEVLKSGQADYVAFARALIADPEWPAKAERGDEASIRPCIACNHGCIHRIDQNLTMGCNVNPYVGREEKLRIGPSREQRDVVVVGAGAAGSEYALRASRRGHRVRLLEATSSVGGQLVFASRPEFKRDLGKLVRFYEYELGNSDVTVELGTEATRELIDELDPDLLVIATGGVPLVPFAPLSGKPYTTYKDVFEERATIEGSAVVVGGGPVGCELAVHLARQGVAITLLEMGDTVARTEDPTIQQFFADEFAAHGVDVRINTRVTQVESDRLQVRGSAGGAEAIPYENLLIAAGVASDRRLAEQLNGSREVQLVGDCRRVATVLDATNQAARLVEAL